MSDKQTGFVWRQPGSDTPVTWDWEKGEFAGQTMENKNSIKDTAEVLFNEAMRLYNEKRPKQALVLIEIAIENSPENFEYYSLKAVICQDLRRFKDSEKFFDLALELEGTGSDVLKNKALMLYDWANSLNDKSKALDIINRALEILPETDLDGEKFWYLKGSVLDCLGDRMQSRICYLTAEGMDDEIRELHRQQEMLDASNDILINITGWQFYFGIEVFTEGLVVDLKRELENEHDGDAIRVEIEGETVGYVANSEHTVIDGVKSASDIKKMNVSKAEVKFIYMDEYVIARLV